MPKPITQGQRRYIAVLRAELGIETDAVPATARGAMNLIGSLVRRRDAERRPAQVAPVRERRDFRVADGSKG